MKRHASVALVLTAGGLKEIYDRNGKRLPFLFHWPFFNSRMKQCQNRGEVVIRYEDRLKSETISRLEKALELYGSGIVELIFNVGGFQPARKKLGLRDSVEMMNDWLIEKGIKEETVIGKAFSVDTGGNIDEFIHQIRKLGLTNSIKVYLVTSWYHLFRSKVELKRALRKQNISAVIKCIPVFPKMDVETLKYEYLFNLLFEPYKILSLIFPGIKTRWRKSEYEARK